MVELDSFSLLPIQATDALGNVTKVKSDYRTLSAMEGTDINENLTRMLVSLIRQFIALAKMGKETES